MEKEIGINLDDIVGNCNTGSEPSLSLEEVLKRYPTARKALLDRIPELRQDAIKEYSEQKTQVERDLSKKYRKEAIYFVIRKDKIRGLEAFPFFDRDTTFSYWEDAKEKWNHCYLCKILDSNDTVEAIDDHMGTITTPVRETVIELIQGFLKDKSVPIEKDRNTLMYLVEWVHHQVGDELTYAKR